MRRPTAKTVARVAELQLDPVAPAGLQGGRLHVTVAMGQVEQPVADPERGAVGADVAKPRRDHGERPVDSELEPEPWGAENLQGLVQGF